MKAQKLRAYKWDDYEITAPGEEYKDESGYTELINRGFICPICGQVCGYIGSQGGIMGCSECGRIWERKDNKLLEMNKEDY